MSKELVVTVNIPVFLPCSSAKSWVTFWLITTRGLAYKNKNPSLCSFKKETTEAVFPIPGFPSKAITFNRPDIAEYKPAFIADL